MVELDGEATGAVCGDGSNYRFWVQLAPAGYDLDDLFVQSEGGGACLINECEADVRKIINQASRGGCPSSRCRIAKRVKLSKKAESRPAN
ncbi:MAG: hypothetical protein AAFV53_09065 [Myxococcota bacterium]